MKLCENCGRETIDKEKFCPNCGGRQFKPKVAGLKTKTCERCKKQVDYVWNCAKCGKLICIDCAKSHGLIDLLCIECDELAKEEKNEIETPKPKPIATEEKKETLVAVKRIDFEKMNLENLAIMLIFSFIIAAAFLYLIQGLRT